MITLYDLADLPRGGNGGTFAIFSAECQRRGLQWPDAVSQQFLFEFGHRDHCLRQYGHLDLSRLYWSLESLPTEQLARATYWRHFDRTEQVARDLSYTLGNYRAVASEYGKEDPWTDSWRDPPVFIDGALVHPPSQAELHLVEGHTRLGVLLGHVRRGLTVADFHQAWVGRSLQRTAPQSLLLPDP